MIWKINFTENSQKQLTKMSKQDSQRIVAYLDERVSKEPYTFGENLKGNFAGLRRYRVGNYRVLCEIQDETITVLILQIGHRSKIYGGH